MSSNTLKSAGVYYQGAMIQGGKWVYDPVDRKMVWVRTPSNLKAPEQNLDQTIQQLVAQGVAMVVVAGVLWFVRELVRSWESS